MANQSSVPRNINPLWIISLFMTFSETVLGIAAFNTSGEIQIALTVFVIIFPLLVAIGFFSLLWFRPEHVYAPKDFGNDESFLKSISEARKSREGLRTLDGDIEERITNVLTSKDFTKKLSTFKGRELKKALGEAAITISSNIRESRFFSLEFPDDIPGKKVLSLPIDGFADFTELTNDIYYMLKDFVPPYTYGYSWVIVDLNNEVIQHIRMISGYGPGRKIWDSRSLKEVGIKAGFRYRILILSRSLRANQALKLTE